MGKKSNGKGSKAMDDGPLKMKNLNTGYVVTADNKNNEKQIKSKSKNKSTKSKTKDSESSESSKRKNRDPRSKRRQTIDIFSSNNEKGIVVAYNLNTEDNYIKSEQIINKEYESHNKIWQSCESVPKKHKRSKSVDYGSNKLSDQSKPNGLIGMIKEPLKRSVSVDRSSRKSSRNLDNSSRTNVSVARSEDCLNSMVENMKICYSLLQLTQMTPQPDHDVCSVVSESTTVSQAKEARKLSKREKALQQQQLKQRGIRIKKQDPRRKSDTFLTQKNKGQRREELAMHPDNPDAKMLAKATKVLQEHVKDVTEKTKNNCCVGKTLQKENMVISNYNNINEANTAHYIVDNNSGITYLRGKLLGKGGFAKCYELIDVKTHKTYAGKIISKSRLTKQHQREKIAREIDLHRNLRHKNVVGFHGYFEDDSNVYIVLEICHRKSLVHVLKSRKTLTEPEVRFYLQHLVGGTKYIHKEKIVHRDLKLGNMLLNEKMEVKIADFGLATRVAFEGEKKMTVCGTPNYIAPEVLQKKGHSYEADIWAMGCVLYALLVGRPPFETATLKETYMRITANKYFIPPHVSKPAKHLIQKLLHPDPEQRPTLDKILADEFLTSGYLPKTLPTSCCDTAPKWPSNSHTPQRPKSYAAPVSPSEAMHKITTSLAQWKGSKKASSQIITHQIAKEEHVPPAANDIRDGNTPTPSVISEPPRKSSRDRSPHHHNNHHHQHHQHSRSRSADHSRRHNSERSKSPPKSPRQVIIETKSVSNVNNQETNNNLINHAHLNGYHPGMVLCSGQEQSVQHFGSSGKVYSSSTTIGQQNGGSQQALHAQSIGNSTTGVNSSRPTSASDKGLPAGSAIRLYQLLTTCLEQMPRDSNPTPVNEAKPLWVTKWVDYSNKYGFGFQLSDKSVGVLFNDTTRMLLAPDGRTIQYNDLSNRVYTFTTDTAPAEHQKKSTLLLYFAQYMGEHLIHGGDLLQNKAGEATAIFMKKWFRTGKAIVMYLNNGTLQVNFFDDHTKVILSPEGQDYLVTYINSSRQALSFRLLQFRHFGCKPDIAERLTYARKMLESIINIEGETV